MINKSTDLVKNKTLCFVPYKRHIDPLITGLSARLMVIVALPQYIGKIQKTPNSFFVTRYTSFGLQSVSRFLGKEVFAPHYMQGLISSLRKYKPTHIITFDLYHWYTMQCIRYIRKYPESKLYIYAETIDWPVNKLSKLYLRFMIYFIQHQAVMISGILVYSDRSKVFLQPLFPTVPVHILSAPIETTQFYLDASKEYMPEGVLRIIMNARYIPLKEHRTFFMALQLLDQKGVKFHASLIGRGGYLQDELQKYAKKLDISQSIAWLEPVEHEELRVIYSSHDVLVLPSNREAIGMVVPEAMACGLATVTSQAVGANTYVEEGKTGLIFETGNVVALADALLTLSRKEVVHAYGQTAAKVIREQYSVEVLGQKLLKALE